MADSSENAADDTGEERTRASAGAADGSGADEQSIEDLRAAVEEQYDFDDFGPEDMKRMSPEEWEAAFDPDSWITGPELVDRVEADLKNRVANRDVFARIERVSEDRLVAYSDEGYAVVHANGDVEGQGTVLRDVEPTVALCSMEEYDVPEPPDGELLPRPMDVPQGSGELGNQMLQVVAVIQLLVGVGLLGGSIVGVFARAGVIAAVAGIGFLFIGALLLLVVANARLSDRFRAEEYRNRLRAVGIDSEERPEFLEDLFEEHPELEARLAEERAERDGSGDAPVDRP
jgi:hypothetical protein